MRVFRALAAALAVSTSLIEPNTPATARPSPVPGTVPVLRIPFPDDDGSLTPITFKQGYPLVTLIYDTLLWRDATGTPQPWLARSIETNADGKRATVHLVPGVHWQDGLPLTSADVQFTIGYFKANRHPRFSSPLAPIDAVEAPDGDTVVFVLHHPAPGLLDQPLADLPILPAHLWKGLAPGVVPGSLPVGSGPYRLTEYLPGRSYRFEANASYFRGPPSVQTLEVPIIPSAEQAVQAMELSRADMLPYPIPGPVADRLQSGPDTIVQGVSYLGIVLWFNLLHPPFDQVAVRRAIAETLDLTRIAGAIGNVVTADRGWLHPSSPLASSTSLHAVDLAAARSVLAPLHLPTLKVLSPDNDPTKIEAARQVAISLQAVGIGAEADPLPSPAFDTAIGQDGSTPNFQMAIGVDPALASYEPNFLDELFGSAPALSPLNVSGYHSAEFDRLAAVAAATSDPATRPGAVDNVLRLLASDVPGVPLFFPVGKFAFRAASYNGWVYVKGEGIFDKLSFVDPGVKTVPPSGAAAGVTKTAGDGISLGLIALICVGLAAVLALLGLLGTMLRRR